MKNEAMNLKIWIDHFYIIDNNSEKIKMTRGGAAADRIDNVRDWNYFDKYNLNTDYEDIKLMS
jgi:hypothetical protein